MNPSAKVATLELVETLIDADPTSTAWASPTFGPLSELVTIRVEVTATVRRNLADGLLSKFNPNRPPGASSRLAPERKATAE